MEIETSVTFAIAQLTDLNGDHCRLYYKAYVTAAPRWEKRV